MTATLGSALDAAVAEALGQSIRKAERVTGGDIHQAYRLTLADGSTRFLKTSAGAPAEMFLTEARGLELLAAPHVLRIPDVVAVGAIGAVEVRKGSEQGFLVLEDLGLGRARSGFDEQLGRGLAALHRFGTPTFGLDHDNFIGTLPQHNAPLPDWATFYRERRLEPLVERAAAHGLADRAFRTAFERLFAKLDELVGPTEPPALLHGDLWGGNLHVADSGEPCLVDPAVYGGHREMDLAMMRLFGGFSSRCFAAYDEAYPLAAGAEERVPLYQLYPLLVHVNLFGGSYVGSVKQALSAYV